MSSQCLGEPRRQTAGAARDLLGQCWLTQLTRLPVAVSGEPLYDGAVGVEAEAAVDVRKALTLLTTAVGRNGQHVR